MIYNMDCIEGAKKYLSDNCVDMILTDPPYNLGFGGTTQTKTKKPRFSVIANDSLSHREYQRFTFQWLYQAHRILKPGQHIYVYIDWRMYPYMVLWMRRVGFIVKNCVVWDKQMMGVGWQYRYQHEFIIFAVKEATKARKISTRSSPDIIRFPRISGNKTVHPTEKPVEMMEQLISNSSLPGEHVVDFFVGAGPVAEAAQRRGRNFTGFEIDKTYYELATKRLKKGENDVTI